MFICLWINASTFWRKKNISANWTWNQTSSCRGKTFRFVILPFYWCHISALLWTINIPWTIYVEGLFKNVFCQTIFPSYENCYFTPFLIPPGSIDLKPLWKGQHNWFFKPNYLETGPQTLMMPGNIVFYLINMTWIIVWMVT